MRVALTVALLVLAAATTPAALAADVPLKLCTARKGGLYEYAGQVIAEEAKGSGVKVQVVETAGSDHNVAALAGRICDAAIVQADAVLNYQNANQRKRLDLAIPLNYLHREYVHLVCRRESGFSSVGDLLGGDKKATVLIGEPGSGGAVTWMSLTRLDKDYKAVGTAPVGSAVAIETLLDGKADCLIYVAGLNTEFMWKLDAVGQSLRLITLDDSDFDDAEVAGFKIYRFAEVPSDAYPMLQSETGDVETITVQAILVVGKAWADRNGDAHDALVEAIEAAKPTILERATKPRPR